MWKIIVFLRHHSYLVMVTDAMDFSGASSAALRTPKAQTETINLKQYEKALIAYYAFSGTDGSYRM